MNVLKSLFFLLFVTFLPAYGIAFDPIDGKPIYEPIDVTVLPMNIVLAPMDITLEPIISGADIDDNADSEALTDGLLALRYLFGFTGDALINNVVGNNAVRSRATEIQNFLKVSVDSKELDIDGNGEVISLTDGLLLLRYLFGFRGDALINGVIADDASRTTSDEIEAYLQSIVL